MTEPLLWLALAGPLALLTLGLVPSTTANAAPAMMARWSRLAAIAALAGAVCVAAAVALAGPLHTAPQPIGFGLWADRLTAVMFVLVAFIGTIVVSYSRNYMDGDANHGRFTKWLCFTLASVLILIVSGNMVQFALAWLATSIGLNRLLLFYRGRPAAILAARKKFIASRISDLCLLGAMWLFYQAFGGLDYGTIFAGAAALSGHAAPLGITLACFLIVVAALLKSAQFPLHGWLIEVMETPTPVSALLHAGIINAGGFLLLRFSDVLVLSAPALDTLALVGGFTALFGSMVMLTQSSIKVSLAWSTIAQMGFMMLQCGLGAWSAALLHIVAHSCYKAHAFLSSGSVVDIARASWSPSPGGAPHPARMGIALGVVLATALVASSLFGATLNQQPGVFALGSIMLFGLTHLIAQSIDERPNLFVIGRTLALAVVVAVTYFGLQWGAAALMAGTLPGNAALRGPLTLVIVIMVVGAFANVTLLQSSLGRAGGSARGRALYVHVSNGFYVNTIANRLVLRLWPARAPEAL
ncbi:MAG: NADH-quinone oxidoreductase subunit L [Sandarakinorhabdus sp.]|nr:NADH-quinone oxidoreductase subunit L [Sandarakinorhabdus sp.]